MEIKQNTLYLTVEGGYVSRDHQNLKVEVEKEVKLNVPIHHLESVCIFGRCSFSPQALQLCWERGVAVNYFNETGFLMGRWEGVPNSSVVLRRAQYRAADSLSASASIARQGVAGNLQNSRQSFMRSARETGDESDRERLQQAPKRFRLCCGGWSIHCRRTAMKLSLIAFAATKARGPAS